MVKTTKTKHVSKPGKIKSVSRIKLLRKRMGFTLQTLSASADISVSYLSRIEGKKRRLNSDTLMKIANSLRCHPAELLEDFVPLRAEGGVNPSLNEWGSGVNATLAPSWQGGSEMSSVLDQTMGQLYPLVIGMNNESRGSLLRYALTLSIAQIGGGLPNPVNPTSLSPLSPGGGYLNEGQQDTYGGNGSASPLGVLQELPVYTQQAPMGGIEGLIDFTRPTRWIARPAELVGIPTAFALEITDNALSPKYRVGDIILVNPTRTLSSGCSSVVLKKDHHILVKEYVETVEDKVIFREFGATEANAGNLEIKNQDLQSMYRVIGSIEAA